MWDWVRFFLPHSTSHISHFTKRLLICGAFLLALCPASCSPAVPSRPDEAIPGIERLLDHPHRLRFSAPASSHATQVAGPTSPQSLDWREDDIVRHWHRAPLNDATVFRSPVLPFASPSELHAIEITLAATNTPAAATLLWGDRETLSREDFLRNHRDLTLVGVRSTFRIQGEDLYESLLPRPESGPRPLRYLFLRIPADPARGVRLESVKIVATRDVYASQPGGRARQALSGDLRDLLYVRVPGAVTYRTRARPNAELVFGLANASADASVQFTITVERPSRPAVTLVERAPNAGWHDARIPLPPAHEGDWTITLSAVEADLQVRREGRPAVTALWANPMIVTSRRDRDPPNVVLYVVDSLRADRLGCFGYTGGTSPFLDRLARQGTLFRRCYTASTWTKPALATLMTSLYPQTHGVGARTYTDTLPGGVTTLAELMRANGYVTAQFVGNPFAASLSNLDQGFDYSAGAEAFGERDADSPPAKVRSDAIHAKVIPWITAHARNRFFLYVHSMDTHAPFGPPPRGSGVWGRESDASSAVDDRYDAEVRFADGQIRRLYEHLTGLGLARKTVFIVTADHGEALGDRGQSGHGTSVYEEEARVPLIMVHPGSIPANLVETPVHHVDLLPTILASCSMPYDRRAFEGVDLLERSAQGLAERTIFVSRFAYPLDDHQERAQGFEAYATIRGDWKLVARQRAHRAPPELALYNLREDPLERRDLSTTDPRRLDSLSRALETFLANQRERRARFLLEHPGQTTMGLSGEPGEAASIPKDLLERLRSLGYVR